MPELFYKIANYATGIILMAVMGCAPEKKESTENTILQEPLFTAMLPAQVNIDFMNVLSEGLNTNILMYEYFYNGSGVAIGDMNGDALEDIYFVSNMGANKFYLNQGNFQFRETTNISQNGGSDGPWKTGVTMVDINGDNKLDIYLCYSGALPEAKRSNQLFINRGNDKNGTPLFKEQAADYGLASTAYSNQAYFFDYDRDGDLDMILLNHNPKSLPVLNVTGTLELLKKDSPLMGLRIYKQVSAEKFVDVTKQVNVSGSELSYGLGVAIGDFNNDSWPDFYVSNDYNVPDYLYMNNQNGTFTDQLKSGIGHSSQFSMGNDAADVNNDGLIDILTLDMLPENNRRQKLLLAPDNYGKFKLNLESGFHYQYMRNMLQINNGDGTFSEVGQIAGVSNTDWSWAALWADYNNDGWKDLFITNGYYRDYTNLDFIKYMNDVVGVKGRLKREDVIDIIKQMPSSNISNYIFTNNKGVTFTDNTKNWGLYSPSNSNGAAYSDLDNDGDLDLVVNNINQMASLYRNNQEKINGGNYLKCKLQGSEKNSQGIGAKIRVVTGQKIQVLEQSPTRGYLSSVSPILHFGLGQFSKVDTLKVFWPKGKVQTLVNVSANSLIVLKEEEAVELRANSVLADRVFNQTSVGVYKEITRSISNDFNRQPQLPYQFSHTAFCLAKGDVNKDSREDIFIGGNGSEGSTLYLQGADGKFENKRISGFESDAKFVGKDAAFLDVDMDGDLDLYVASGGYGDFNADDPQLQDRLYINDGLGDFKRNLNALPPLIGSKSCVRINDVNDDGFPDVFVGGRVIPGRYPETPPSYLLMNDGHGKFTNRIQFIAPDLERLGMITDAQWIDMDLDGKEDLVVVGEWMPVSIWLNKSGQLVESTNKFFDKSYYGLWNVITSSDLNGDNKPDLVVGNWGLNSQYSASDNEPMELYYADFDRNSSVDPILCMYIQGKNYPYLTRDELLEQQSRFRQKYNTYKSYADVTIHDLLSVEELSQAKRLQANHLSTTLFLSRPSDNLLQEAELPIEVQYSPVFTITVNDFDADGKVDLLLCGNIEDTKLKIGKLDANYGMLLRGIGNGQFEYVNQVLSGMKINGDVRHVIMINNNIFLSTIQKSVLVFSTVKQSNQ